MLITDWVEVRQSLNEPLTRLGAQMFDHFSKCLWMSLKCCRLILCSKWQSIVFFLFWKKTPCSCLLHPQKGRLHGYPHVFFISWRSGKSFYGISFHWKTKWKHFLAKQIMCLVLKEIPFEAPLFLFIIVRCWYSSTSLPKYILPVTK